MPSAEATLSALDDDDDDDKVPPIAETRTVKGMGEEQDGDATIRRSLLNPARTFYSGPGA